MPLSERERRLLEEMERSFYSSDSDVFASDPAKRGRPSYRSLLVGILLALAGLSAVLAGIATHIPLIGIGGFVLMLAGVAVATTRARSRGREDRPGARRPSARSAGRPAAFMDRLAERWDRRQDDGR